MSERRCKVCGEEYDAALMECPWCGAPAPAEGPAVSGDEGEPPAVRFFTSEEAPPEEVPEALETPAKRRRWPGVVCALIAVCAAAGALAWRFWPAPAGPFIAPSPDRTMMAYVGTGYLGTVSDKRNPRGAVLVNRNWIMDMGNLGDYSKISASADGSVVLLRDFSAFSSSSWYNGSLSGGGKEKGPSWILCDRGTVTTSEDWNAAGVTGDGKVFFYVTEDETGSRLIRRSLTDGTEETVDVCGPEERLALSSVGWDGSVVTYSLLPATEDSVRTYTPYLCYRGEEPMEVGGAADWLYAAGTAAGAVYSESLLDGGQVNMIGWRKDGQIDFHKAGRIVSLMSNNEMTELFYLNEDGAWYETAAGAQYVTGLPEGTQYFRAVCPRYAGGSMTRVTDWVYQYSTAHGTGVFYLDADLNIRVLVEAEPAALSCVVDNDGAWLVYWREGGAYRIADMRDPYPKVETLWSGTGGKNRWSFTPVPGGRDYYILDYALSGGHLHYVDEKGNAAEAAENVGGVAVLKEGACWFMDGDGALWYTRKGGAPVGAGVTCGEVYAMTRDLALGIYWDETGRPQGWRLEADGTMAPLEEITYGPRLS